MPAPEVLWAILPQLDRAEIEAAVEALIAQLDADDGDPDFEDDGIDEPDGTGEGDQSWPQSGPYAMTMCGEHFHEDAENEHDREDDRSDLEETWPETGDGRQPMTVGGGLAVSDDDAELDGKRIRDRHAAFIRATRCDVDRRRWGPTFYLREPRTVAFGSASEMLSRQQ